MSRVEERLGEMGVTLPNLPAPIARYVPANSTQDFDGQALVINGAPDFLVDVFGETGKHIRTAVGIASLPIGFAASVCIIAEVE